MTTQHALEISVSKINLDCETLAHTLMKCGVVSSVSPNVSIICEEGKCWKEKGCRIITKELNSEKLVDFWYTLKHGYGFSCAHLKIPNKYDGCILEYIEKQ